MGPVFASAPGEAEQNSAVRGLGRRSVEGPHCQWFRTRHLAKSARKRINPTATLGEITGAATIAKGTADSEEAFARNSKVGRSAADRRRDFDPPAVLPEVIGEQAEVVSFLT